MITTTMKYSCTALPYTLLIAVFIFCSISLKAENLKKIMNMEGTWKFTIGDDLEWAEVNYDDKEWDYVYVPRSWESSGFINYNGYAWYRKEFQINGTLDEESLFLIIGYIDDVDEVYLNGELIGTSGVFPPLVRTAYDVLRKYPFPTELLNKQGKNVIAVRVFDDYREGGIYKGPIGIFYDEDNNLLSLNLTGYWDFETVDKASNNADKIYNQQDGKIYVPGFWETRGFTDFDGSGVYTTTFRLPDRFDEEDIMIVVGYIDDIDKVYINDIKVGTVSDMRNRENRDTPDHQILRGYPIPTGTLNRGGVNTLIVKVYDTGGLGGIYEGPVGLITTNNFKLLKEKQVDRPYNKWENIFKSIFE